jgi:hypothetical protein
MSIGKATFGEALQGVRLFASIPRELHRRMPTDLAQNIIAARLASRADDFLRLVAENAYNHPVSPYAALLKHAGCELGDLERLVRTDGLEYALHALYKLGVYLTLDELKGRVPAVRGGFSMLVDARNLRKAPPGVHIPATTSGRGGRRTPVTLDFASTWRNRPNMALALAAQPNTQAWDFACWRIPGASAFLALINHAQLGIRVVRWFTHVAPDSTRVHPRYRWSARIVRWASVVAGKPLPPPEYAPPHDPEPILRWIAEVRDARRIPYISTYPSSAVGLCLAAETGGVDISGTIFTLSGEPVTDTRVERIRRSGASIVTSYSAMEVGRVGWGCCQPSHPDDTHLFHDLHAVIQPGEQNPLADLPGDALLYTSLRWSSRMFLLNASIGDRATMEERPCGCPLDSLGWTTHLCDISAYAKVTAGGMTFFDSDLIRVLEDVLPNRFGGAPAQYQLVEQETESGRPRLALMVDPALGDLDEQAVIDAFLSAIGAGSGVEHVMELKWRSDNLVGVIRDHPRLAASGKVRHLLRARSAADIEAPV